MRFGVLGPVAVWTDDGVPIRIRESKVRALLADLLIHEGQVVPASRLINDLWQDKQPRDPTNALQLRVSQLRRALDAAEPGARSLIVSQPPGYLLAPTAASSDVARFRSLVGTSGDPQTRAACLSEALGLWRGAPYADFAAEPFARGAAERLEEERLAAVESLADARLDLGEHSQLVGELGDLVRQHPLRQRLRATYLKALYRAGRHDEALDSYRALQKQLRDELGLDPTAELAALQQAILRQDPTLVGKTPSTSGQHTNLPAPLTKLIGRDPELAELTDLLKTQRLVTLTGPGGVGKSSLAIEAARNISDQFADGIWLIELAGTTVAAGAVVEAIATTLGIREHQLLDALSNQQTLVVLDNCEHLIPSVVEVVADLLRRAPKVVVLATSQEPLSITGEHQLVVPPLETANAVELFIARATSAGYEYREEDLETVQAICRRLDGIPLALELAATRTRALGVDGLAARLDDRFRLLAGRRDGPARQQTLRATVDWSWDLLSEPEQIMLRRLSVHADSWSLDARFGEVEVLGRLVDRSLVTVVDGPRYRLLESVKLYSAERLREAGEYDEIHRQAIRWYTKLAEQAEPKLYGHDQREWLARLDVETPNLRAALDYAVRLGESEWALRLVDALAWYWFLRGRVAEAGRAFEAALRVSGGDSEAPGAGEGGASGVGEGEAPGIGEGGASGVGEGAQLNGGLRQRVVGWQAGIRLLGDDETRAAAARTLLAADSRIRAHWFLGFAHRGGAVAATAEIVDKALAEYRAAGDRWGIAAALSVRGTLGRASGELATAERDAAESEAIFRELGDRWGLLKATNSLAELAEISGDYDRAVRLHSDGLQMAEELGLWGEASLRLSGLGRIALLHKDFNAAEEFHTRAMHLAASQGNKPAEEFAELGLGLGARRAGNLDKAEHHLRRWLDWLRQLPAQPGVPLVLAELGFIAEQRGDATGALRLQTDGLAAAEAVGDPRALALAHEGLAGAYSIAGDLERATGLLREAERLRESVGAPLPPAERGDVDRISARLTPDPAPSLRLEPGR